jgi:hypothetical protein
MVYTKDVIVFAKVGQEVVLDVIPLAEVLSVKPVDQIPAYEYLPRTCNTMLLLMISLAIVGALTMVFWNIKLALPWPSSPSRNSALSILQQQDIGNARTPTDSALG